MKLDTDFVLACSVMTVSDRTGDGSLSDFRRGLELIVRQLEKKLPATRYRCKIAPSVLVQIAEMGFANSVYLSATKN